MSLRSCLLAILFGLWLSLNGFVVSDVQLWLGFVLFTAYRLDGMSIVYVDLTSAQEAVDEMDKQI